ncbi:MAG: PAS domain S-box protein [Planctomycetes bacterium]|nr:PAS domain S-box protein [Planctomycetota bacterium]
MNDVGRNTGVFHAWLNTLFEEAAEGLLLLDAETGSVLAANPACHALLGCGETGLVGCSWRELAPAESHGRMGAAIAAAVEAGRFETYAQELLRRDGHVLPVEVRAFAVRDGKESARAVALVIRDATEHKVTSVQADELAREYRLRTEELAALDALGREVSSSLALDTVIASAIRGMQRATGADLVFLFLREGHRLILKGAEPESGRRRMGQIPEHRVGECLCGLAGRMARPVYSRDIYHDMRCTWEECKQAGFRSFAALPLKADTEVIGVMGLASVSLREFATQDKFLETLAASVASSVHNARLFTELKEAAAEVDQERRFADAILAGLPGVFYLFDEQGHFLRWNRNFETVTGYNSAEMGRLHPLDLFRGPDRELVASRIARVFSEGVADAEADFVSKDGRAAPYYFTGTRIAFEGKPCLIGVGVDVSERRELQHRLMHSEKLAAIGRLAGGVAHDFNNQLTVVMGCADLLARALQDTPHLKHADSIVMSAQRSAELTRQLLTFSRKGKKVSTPVDMNRLVQEVTALLQRSVDKSITVHAELRATHPVVIGDPTLLQNAILNLALNSRDAMPGGGKLVISTESVACTPKNCNEADCPLRDTGCLRLVVSDSGCGMTEDVRQHLFEPFFTTKAPGKGTGMGLASVYGTVQSHGGHIHVESEVGEGTRISMCLPVADSSAAPVEQPRLQVTGIGARILLVEDEEAVREMVQEALHSLGYRVKAFAGGREAVEYFGSSWNEVDVVILDLMMPGMGGREVFKAMKRIQPGVRALISSGFGPEGQVEAALKDGILDYISKPYLIADLARKIEAVLARPPAAH